MHRDDGVAHRMGLHCTCNEERGLLRGNGRTVSSSVSHARRRQTCGLGMTLLTNVYIFQGHRHVVSSIMEPDQLRLSLSTISVSIFPLPTSHSDTTEPSSDPGTLRLLGKLFSTQHRGLCTCSENLDVHS
jgi:hypothetical protein